MISDYDKAHIDNIVGGHGDWFTAQLIRLMCKADTQNIERFRLGFPEEVAVYEAWKKGNLMTIAALRTLSESGPEPMCWVFDPKNTGIWANYRGREAIRADVRRVLDGSNANGTQEERT